MRKAKKRIRFAIRWILNPTIAILLLGMMIMGGYNFYREGRYFAHVPECITEQEITYNGTTERYAVVKFDSKRDDELYLENGKTCQEFDQWEEDNKIQNVYGVTGWKLGIVATAWWIGSILLFVLVVLAICIPIVFIICGASYLWENVVEEWIIAGGRNKEYQ